jgi:large subunit ribosomal protein L15e
LPESFENRITEAKMSMYKYIREAWKRPRENLKEFWNERLIQWRRQPATVRIERPTRLDRARSLGYKAKDGIIVVRQRVERGGRLKAKPKGGRRSVRFGKHFVLRKNYQLIAEERANDHYLNCEVLNSYFVGKDGVHYWYEVILADRYSPSIKADSSLKWVTEAQHKGRVYRGLTSAGRKMRGLMYTGKGSEKKRPSRNSKR